MCKKSRALSEFGEEQLRGNAGRRVNNRAHPRQMKAHIGNDTQTRQSAKLSQRTREKLVKVYLDGSI